VKTKTRFKAGVRRTGIVSAAATAVTILTMSAALAWTGDNNSNGQIDRDDTGPAVVCAQQGVIYNGGSVGSSGADGRFGPNTDAGVHWYQSHRTGLDADGQVGPHTGGVMATDIRNLRVLYHRTGDMQLEQRMVSWMNRCIVSTYHDNTGHQIFH
jgi:peptidoglycan hydrolase-like protein with peptidoglycan-binding domain